MSFRFFLNARLATKITCLVACIISLFLLGFILVFLPYIEDDIIASRRAFLADITEMALSVLKDQAAAVQNGRLDLKTAQDLALRQIRTLRYGKEGYFWVQDMQEPTPVILMHPTMPWLEGKSLNDPIFEVATSIRLGSDPKSLPSQYRNLFHAFIAICRTAGSGYVAYLWPKPTGKGTLSAEPAPKESYVVLFKPWEWIVGTGLYIDDIYENIAKVRWFAILFLSALILVASMAAMGLTAVIVRPFKRLAAFTHAVADGDFSVRTGLDALGDELGQLAKAFDDMAVKLEKREQDRAAAEHARFESEAKMRAIFQNAMQLIGLLSPEGRILECNKAALDAISARPDDVIGKDFWDTPWWNDSPEKQERLRLAIAKARQGETDRFETTHTGPVAGTRYIDFSITPVLDATGQVRLLIPEGRDITERKLAERELEASEDKFRSIVESSPMAMYFYQLTPDDRLVLTGVNPAADDVMGFPHQEFLGRPIEDIFPGLAGTSVPEQYRQVARGEIGPQSYQSAYQDERVSARHDVHVFRTGPGAIAVDILDVTERVRLQEMMIQSEKMASVGGLAAGMAHEINNPLSSILQAAQVSLMQLDPAVPANRAAAEACGCDLEAMRRYLEKRHVLKFLDGIQEAGKRAAQIVSSMLEFSRRSESRRAPADINAVLDKSVELASTDYDLKKKYDFRHIAIVRQYAPGLPEVSCTRTEIEQVILNLLKNAAQAMTGAPAGEGGPTIVLRTARAAGSVRIEVADNGPGMTEAVRRRVFEPFFTTKEPGQGTGLGLSVSYFIITSNHGGSIRVESEPGKGARFIIDLPIGGRK
jgi:polar amino acid transport system substrate-binding protein